MNSINYLRLQSGIAGPLPEILADATPLEGVDYIKAQDAGILTFLKVPGTRVEKGELIAEIIDPIENCILRGGERIKRCITSNISGTLFARCVDRFARPGKIVAKIAGTEPLVGKGDKLLTS
ncbi:MAG: putative deacylase [Desulforhopalus sp.]